MDVKQEYLELRGLVAAVALKVDQKFAAHLPYIFSQWPYDLTATTEKNLCATIEQLPDGRFRLSSPHLDKAQTHNDVLNVLCALVAELAWQRLREDPSLLCIHGAAAEFSGRLVIFPATRRAGKSTLSVAMAAAGIRMFTDDFLPVSVGEDGIIRGISSGVSPRLRLPFPPQIGENANRYMENRLRFSNKQYSYVKPLKPEQASFGEALPIGSVVILERSEGAKASLTEYSTADTLKMLIYQNFSRAGNAADILAMLDFVARNLPCYRLIYDHAEDAIALLTAHYSAWETPVPAFHPRAKLGNEAANGPVAFTRYTNTKTGRFEQADGVEVVAVEGQRFLTGRNGQSIHYLNEGAALIWQILSEPASLDEAVDILCAAFPEQERETVYKDVARCFKDFGANGLLQKTGAAPPMRARAAQNLAR